MGRWGAQAKPGEHHALLLQHRGISTPLFAHRNTLLYLYATPKYSPLSAAELEPELILTFS